jgi:phage baseplate assembly protein W
MELKLENGGYVPARYLDLAAVSGAEELAQRIVMKLTARRGGFAPLPDYGSRLYLLMQTRPSERMGAARQYVAEALADESGIELESISLSEPEAGTLLAALSFSAGGGSLSVTTAIGGT